MGHTSLWSQIRVALYSLCVFGESRYIHEQLGDAEILIFYHPTYRMYIYRCWAIICSIQQRYGINMLIKIRPWMVREEIERRVEKGQSAWSLWSYVSALKKLEKGVYRFYGYRVKLIPRNLQLPARSVTHRRGRFAYTPSETRMIIDAAYDTGLDAAVVLDLISRTGLHLHEALNLRGKDYDGVLTVFKGKGGKRRMVPIEKENEVLINKLFHNKDSMDLVFSGITERQVRYCMKKACEEVGIEIAHPHNLRHSYAVRRYKSFRDQGLSDKDARMKVSSELGHNKLSVTYSYIPPQIRPGRRK